MNATRHQPVSGEERDEQPDEADLRSGHRFFRLEHLAGPKLRMPAPGWTPAARDRELIDLTTACLAPEAVDRPKDAQAVAEALTAYLDSVQARLHKAERAEAEAKAKAVEEVKRRRVTVALAGTVLLALLLGGGGWLSVKNERDAREAQVTRDVNDAMNKATAFREQAKTEALGSGLLFAQAREQAQRALALVENSPADFWVNLDLGTALQKVTPPEWDEAVRFQTAAVALRPESSGAHLSLGLGLLWKGQLDEAIASFQRAIDLNAQLAPTHSNLGDALNAKGELDEAIACCRMAIALDPKHAVSRTNLGDALNAKGELDEAIASLRKATELDPKYPNPHKGLGHVHARKGQWQEAAASLARASELDPKDNATAFLLSFVLAERGDLPVYQEYCKTMLTRWGRVTNPALAERTAKACLLLKGGVPDPGQLAPLVQTALSAGEKHGTRRVRSFRRMSRRC